MSIPSPAFLLRTGTRLLAASCALAASLAGAAPALGPALFNDGTPADAAPLGTRVPLVLVHGLGGSAEGWHSFLRAYEQHPAWRAAFKPYAFTYATSTAEVLADPAAPRSIAGLGAALRDALQAQYDKPAAAPDFGFAGKRLVLLAHSMGGLVARAMMQEQRFRDGERAARRC